jgi:hypothetical protein
MATIEIASEEFKDRQEEHPPRCGNCFRRKLCDLPAAETAFDENFAISPLRKLLSTKTLRSPRCGNCFRQKLCALPAAETAFDKNFALSPLRRAL